MKHVDTSAVRITSLAHEHADHFLALIDALADYEKLARPDAAAKQRLLEDGLGTRQRFEAFLAWIDDTPVGYAITFETYSSFLAKPTQYLEDIFILPEYRKQKAGLALFLHVAGLARTRGCGRMEWTVLDWNTSAQSFYDALGAVHLREWFLYRLTEEQLATLPH
ncbi:MAG: GNAT family N-acetyltransferase [Bacteroidia bacterium]|nr:GNAT family N-acetyltransferase [Bacteroidia bacterium]